MRLHTLFFAATLVASSSTAFADPITRLFVLGDSVSDNGNLAALSGGTVPAPPYAPGRASNGPVAVEYLSQALGLGPLLPAAMGGTNFAVIGAATGNVPVPGRSRRVCRQCRSDAQFELPPTGHAHGTARAVRPAESGPDRPGCAVRRVGRTQRHLDQSQPGRRRSRGGQHRGRSIDTLYGAGARNFLVPNMADLGLAPGASMPPWLTRSAWPSMPRSRGHARRAGEAVARHRHRAVRHLRALQ